jgi:hypothetical protein
MKQRFTMFRRGRVYYCQDSSNGHQENAEVTLPPLEEYEMNLSVAIFPTLMGKTA